MNDPIANLIAAALPVLRQRDGDESLSFKDVAERRALRSAIAALEAMPPAPEVDGDTAFTLQNTSREVLKLNVDGSIDWMGQRLNTAPEVGRALTEFVKERA